MNMVTTQALPVPQPQSGGFMGGLQAFSATYGITKQVKGDIDAKRQKRALDKVLSNLDGKEPTQAQYMQLLRLGGPVAAKSILQFHNSVRERKAADRKLANDRMRLRAEFAGTLSEYLRGVPEQERPNAFGQALLPLIENDEEMKERIGKPLGQYFQDGDFSDKKLNALSALAMMSDRYAEIHNNKLKAAAKKEMEALDRQSKETIAETAAAAKIEEARLKNPPRSEIIKMSKEMTEVYGGRPADWAIFLRDADKFIGEGADASEGFINKATNKPLDLGSFSRQSMIPGDPLGQAPAPGSPATIKRRRPGR